MTIDPVCGMKADEKKGIFSEYQGARYYFCSQKCKANFEKAPRKYIDALKKNESPRVESDVKIAYFSMEIGIDSHIPTYSGGLGILAGDTLKSCADLRVPVVGVTLLYRKGYFHQTLDGLGNQQELPITWNPEEHLMRLTQTIDVGIEGRNVKIGVWRYDIEGVTDFKVPVLFLDTNIDGNDPEEKALCDFLYSGDQRHRLSQEIVLGIGGVRILKQLGYKNVQRYHMNEGHAALLVLELLRESKTDEKSDFDYDSVRHKCIFTTHTPVPAGHDKFDYELVKSIMGESFPADTLHMLGGSDELNMTFLALNMSHYVNGVAKRHGEISREMFPTYTIDSITNGIHSYTWTCDSFRALFEKHIPGWRADPLSLRYSLSIPKEEIWDAHKKSKNRLIDHINQTSNAGLDSEALTIGFARRATQYKRADLLFSDLEKLRQTAKNAGKLQFVFAGKAHPKDNAGKDLIRKIISASKQLGADVPVIYLPDYDMDMARMLVSGVDLWLNTPRKPMEASGTSGMKAAHNGVPSFSVLDGWWLEGHIEGVTGWAIGTSAPFSNEDNADAAELYSKLEYVIVPMYYNNRDRWIDVMRHSIAVNASFFNTHRMVQQYVINAYL
ncbi:MAG: alpha-glucan family phosphorylase [Sedimentisphaerales bacterium]|nr:alpha-glucan family phosphorylase [Sedimentisphaerales bacterium]